MRRREIGAVVATLVAGLLTAACTPVEESAPDGGAVAAQLQPVDEERSRLVLTPRAVERLGLQTAAVTAFDGGARRSVPYAAIVYDSRGQAWTYLAEGPRAFLRSAVAVDRYAGDAAVLTEGPPVGAQVVTAGAAELLGAELDVGK